MDWIGATTRMRQVSNFDTDRVSDTDSAECSQKTLKLMRPAAFIKAGPLVVGAVALILGAAFPAWAALGGTSPRWQA